MARRTSSAHSADSRIVSTTRSTVTANDMFITTLTRKGSGYIVRMTIYEMGGHHGRRDPAFLPAPPARDADQLGAAPRQRRRQARGDRPVVLVPAAHRRPVRSTGR